MISCGAWAHRTKLLRKPNLVFSAVICVAFVCVHLRFHSCTQEPARMKLLRYGPPGREKPGLADREGNVRDLSKVITQLDDSMLAPRNLARLARVKPETLPIVRGSPR